MVDVNMGDQQGLDALYREVDCKVGRWARLVTLKQTAIDQQALSAIKIELVTGAGYALGGAVVGNSGKIHTSPFHAFLRSTITPQMRVVTVSESDAMNVGNVLFLYAVQYSAA